MESTKVNVVVAIAAIVVVATRADAGAELRQLVQEIPYSIEPDGAPQPFPFQRLDDLGGAVTILDVVFEVDALVAAEVTVENDSDQILANFNLSVFGNVVTTLDALPSPTCNFFQSYPCPEPSVAPSDGVPGSGPDLCDFGTVATATQACPAFGPPPPNFDAFLGAGTIDAQITAIGGFNVSSPLAVTLTFDNFRAEGLLRLTYEYLVETGGCCLNNGTCLVTDQVDCESQSGTYLGDDTDCVAGCPGACCLEDSSCVDATGEQCIAQDGVYVGFGSTCTSLICPGVPRGCGQKGSLVIFPAVEVRWNSAGVMTQDVFVSLYNDYPDDVRVQMYFVNGDAPLPADGDERPHPGWNHVSAEITLTRQQPTYWSAFSGQTAGVPPWWVLDPGDPHGRIDPEQGSDRMIRGYIVAWAVDDQNREIRWNHLGGSITTVDYAQRIAWETRACAFQVVTDAANGQLTGQDPGVLNLDGIEYAACPDLLLLDFHASGSSPFGADITIDTDLTLLPVSVDLRQEDDGPVTTKAKIDVWNENEFKFNGAERCITCWDQTLLSQFTLPGVPNNFLFTTLQTDAAKARIDGITSQNCDFDFDVTDGPLGIHPFDLVSIDAALIGIARRRIDFDESQSSSARQLVGLGLEVATIRYDVATGSEESTSNPAATAAATPSRSRR